VPVPRDNTPHISHHISLEEFTPHFPSPETTAEPRDAGGRQLEGDNGDAQADSDEAEPSYYTHPCRCSGEFVITHQDLEDGVEVVGCEGCGEWVRVGYEVIEEEDDDDDEAE
jgi:diphthamide biosynthesis protein 4